MKNIMNNNKILMNKFFYILSFKKKWIYC